MLTYPQLVLSPKITKFFPLWLLRFIVGFKWGHRFLGAVDQFGQLKWPDGATEARLYVRTDETLGMMYCFVMEDGSLVLPHSRGPWQPVPESEWTLERRYERRQPC